MKNILILLFILGTQFTQANVSTVRTWINHKDKVINYTVLPELDVALNKLDIGDNDFYAMMVIKTKPSDIMVSEVQSLAPNYKLKYLALRMSNNTATLSFPMLANGYPLTVYNGPSGVYIDEIIYNVSKRDYYAIKKNPHSLLSIDFEVNPLVNKLVGTKELPQDTCRELRKDGSFLFSVARKLNQLIRGINRMYIENDVKKELIDQVYQKCFGEKEYRAFSIRDLMNLFVKVEEPTEPISVNIYKSKYESHIIEEELHSEAEIE